MLNIYHHLAGRPDVEAAREDLLRAAHVLLVSALDHYVHEIVLAGMLQAYDKQRERTDAFLKFKIPLNLLDVVADADTTRSNVENEIRTQHSFLSFQKADKIADAIRLFHAPKLWDAVAQHMRRDATEVKNQLNLIVERRNKIAHEADLNPAFGGILWPISLKDVNGTLEFIKSVVLAIDDLVWQ